MNRYALMGKDHKERDLFFNFKFIHEHPVIAQITQLKEENGNQVMRGTYMRNNSYDNWTIDISEDLAGNAYAIGRFDIDFHESEFKYIIISGSRSKLPNICYIRKNTASGKPEVYTWNETYSSFYFYERLIDRKNP